MNTLEREIIEKFHQLEPDAKLRVRALIEQEIASESSQTVATEFDYDAWFRDGEALRQQIRASHDNTMPSIDVVGMLREIRDGE